MTDVDMEMLLQGSGMGTSWVPIERVIGVVRPQATSVYRVGMLVGRVDLLLGIVCRN